MYIFHSFNAIKVKESNTPLRVLFVCLGNICRSPAAEAVFSKISKDQNLTVVVDSAGTSGWHAGEQADRRMRVSAKDRGYAISSISRPFERKDFDRFDLIIAMDDSNFNDLKALAATIDEEKKLYRMRDFLQSHTIDHIPDPYYGGAEGFNFVIDLLEDASMGLIDYLRKQ